MAYLTNAKIAEMIADKKVREDQYDMLDFVLGELQASEATLMDPGAKAWGILRVALDVVNGETVTIGADVFEVDIINTDSTDNAAGGDFANTTDPLIVDMSGYTNISLSAGDLIRLETEILQAVSVVSDDVTFRRGACGTTTASHADTTDIYVSDSAPTNIPIGLVTTLTPTVFTAALVEEINEDVGSVAVHALVIDANTILVMADTVGVLASATTETLAGVGNAWDQVTLVEGAVSVNKQVYNTSHVPQAEEVTAGTLYLPIPFDASSAVIVILTTSSGIPVAWNGALTLVDTAGGASAYLSMDNAGAVDWAVTDTIYITVIE